MPLPPPLTTAVQAGGLQRGVAVEGSLQIGLRVGDRIGADLYADCLAAIDGKLVG